MGEAPAKRRVGVMGGAFDPPHLAHAALMRTACEQLVLDELRVIPTGQAWHKPRALTAGHHRLAMAKLAFSDIPQMVLDPREVNRAGPSFTIDTLNELLAESPRSELFLVIGADQALALTSWRSWQELVQIAIICVADRTHSTGANTEFDAEIAYPSRFRHLQMPAMAISATDIRARISAHQGISALVREPVARYIADHHLYQTD